MLTFFELPLGVLSLRDRTCAAVHTASPRPRGWCGHPSGSLAVGRNLGTLRLLLGAAYLCSGAVVIGCLGPMVGTVVVAVNPPGPSAQMAIAEAAGPCPEDTAFCRERNPPMPTRGDNGLTFKKKEKPRTHSV